MITRLFTGRFILGLQGIRSPFVFIWDQDLINIIAYGVQHDRTGQFNVAGDGCLSMEEISDILGIPLRRFPVWLIKLALTFAKSLKLTPFGPEQIRFMQYRPVLSNVHLKNDFGLAPSKTSREVLEFFAARQSEQHR
jgi:UDP-glucose 4-epimerase